MRKITLFVLFAILIMLPTSVIASSSWQTEFDLGNYYYEEGKAATALRHYKDATAIAAKVNGTGSSEVMFSMVGQAKCNIQLESYESALPPLIIAKVIADSYEPNKSNLVLGYINFYLGIAEYKTGRYHIGVDSMRLAVKIMEKNLAAGNLIGSQLLKPAYIELAAMLEDSGAGSEAEIKYLRAKGAK